MNRALGISFSSDRISFTELAKEAGKTRLENAETVKLDFNFEEELAKHKSSQKDLTNISGELQNYFTRRNSSGCDIALTISTSQSFLLTIPIDYSDGKQAINSKIYWELSNYFPEDYNDYVINTYRLNSVMPCRDCDEFLIIAVHKNTLEFVKRIFKICSHNLALVDIDHFAAEHSLRYSYADSLSGSNAILVGLRQGRVDYGYVVDKKYKFYSYSRYYSEPEFNLSLVRKINSLLRMEQFKEGADRIYLYGDEIRDDTLDALNKIDGMEIEILNPFESITASEQLLKNEKLRKSSYLYASSCGVALRLLAGK